MKWKWAAIGVGAIVILTGAAFLISARSFTIGPSKETATSADTQNPAGKIATTSNSESSSSSSVNLPLANPPVVLRGLYLTGWSAGLDSRVAQTIALMKKNGLNAVVIDIKDYSGHVSYPMDIPEIKNDGADKEIRVADIDAVIRKFHAENIYVIGRITVFQDPILAKAHPEWAMQNAATGRVWTDRKGLSWMDPASQNVWQYDLAIAKDALNRGFDEVNFDYVRFASDGSLGTIKFPVWDQKTPKAVVIESFFKFLRSNLQGKRLSADLFGLSTVNKDDLGIGQVIESAYKYFDYICPMVYPSHFANGFIGYKNPAEYPYQVIDYSMAHALTRLADLKNSTSTTQPVTAKLRPWLQAFNMGAVYDKSMIDDQIRATDNVLASASSSWSNGGWLLWDAANTYIPLK